MRTYGSATLLAAALLFAATKAEAQNLVVNGGFEADPITGWDPVGATGSRAWSADDINASAASGSAEFSIDTTGEAVGLAQCLAVGGATDYDYYARMKFPTGQPAGSARALVDVQFFSSPDCSGTALGAEGQGAVVGAAYALDDAAWYGIPGEAELGTKGRATSPAAAASARLRIYVEQLAGSDTQVVRFDEVVFHDASTVPVTLQSFQVE